MDEALRTPAPATGRGLGAPRRRETLHRASPRQGWAGRLRRYLLDVPLFYKILLADAGIIFVIGIVSVGIVVQTMNVLTTQPLLVFWVAALGGMILTVPIRLYVLRRTLAPIEVLQDTAERVEVGDMNARAAQTPLSDPRLARLTDVFNRVLDTVVADRNRLQEIAAKAFRAQEAERVRIARELHEEVAQTMTGLLLRVRMLRAVEGEEERSEAMDELRRELVHAMDSVREFARGLHPPALADLGLAAALEGLGRTVSASADLPVEVVSNGSVRGRITPERELALYRIVQEALANVVHHAAARRVRVEILPGEDTIDVRIADDGVGFDLDAAEEALPCIGLFGMRERALYMGGTVEIESAPGRGTVVTARMPAGE